MTFAEPLELRRLCAADAEVDPAFGPNGRVPLSGDLYIVDNLLATHGSVYAAAIDRRRHREVIFKYSEQGVLDTKWGLGGYIVPKIYARSTDDIYYAPFAVMAYDARTRGLVVGYGDVDRVIVERRTADGSVDTTWGNAGYFSYRVPKTQFSLKVITPMAKKNVMLTVRRQGLDGPVVDNERLPGGADDLAVMRLDRLGRFDRAFNKGRTLTIATDGPQFCDVQPRSDGGVRVIVTRTATATDKATKKRRVTVSAESISVSGTGALGADSTQRYVLKRYDPAVPYSTYTPVAAFAVGGSGVAVFADTNDGAPMIQVGPGLRSTPVDVLPKDVEAGEPLSAAKRGPDGSVLLRGSFGTLRRLRPDFTPDTNFGQNGYKNPSQYRDLYVQEFTLDDTNRVVVWGPDTLARLD